MSTRRVVITGMGTVNPLAHSVEETWQKLLAAEKSFGLIQTFEAGTFPSTSTPFTAYTLQSCHYSSRDREWR